MSIFMNIINKEVPADIVYEDDLCMAFHDVNPAAPIHVLLIPKKPIEKLSDAKEEDEKILGHLMLKVGEITRKLGCEDAFRIVINNGKDAQQTVFHLHLHILAQRGFNWPPG